MNTVAAGRDLDALVAQKVMGWHCDGLSTVRGGTWVDSEDRFKAEAECGTEYGSGSDPCQGECDEECLRFRPSTDGRDAQRIVAALKERKIVLKVDDPTPENICRAALQAVGS